MFDKSAPEVPTTELFLGTVTDRETCPKHNAPIGFPCWVHESSHPGVLVGSICHRRAKRAGFNGRISEKSLRINRFNKK